MERITLLISIMAASAVAQTSVSIVTAANGTATAGQVAGYSMNGVYKTDGTTLNFETSLTFPISQAINATVLQTYL